MKLVWFALISIVCLEVSEACSRGGRGTTTTTTTARPIGSRCSQFELVTRSGWGARAPKSVSRISVPVRMAFVHHTDTASCYSKSSCSARMRSIQAFHQDTRRWSDIGYSFLVGQDGRAYEGRGWGVAQAQSPNYNTIAHSFTVIGDFQNQLPNNAALTTLKNLIACGVEKRKLTSNYELFGHRDGRNTQCPGNRLYNEIRTWPRYSTRRITKY